MPATNNQNTYEEPLWFQQCDVIIGLDEVGRGALAGPIYASAVAITSTDFQNWLNSGPMIRDSKKMSRTARAVGCAWMEGIPLITETAWINPHEIDELGITWANKQAMQTALDGCREKIPQTMRVKIISDHVLLRADDPFESFPRAESRSFAVACASVWAKEQRDAYMKKLAQIYPNYGWETHVGYGTAKHRDALKKHGPTPEHRRTFISNYLD